MYFVHVSHSTNGHNFGIKEHGKNVDETSEYYNYYETGLFIEILRNNTSLATILNFPDPPNVRSWFLVFH